MIVKDIAINKGELFAITCGKRYPVAVFNGYIRYEKDQYDTPVLGKLYKQMKPIKVRFIICDDVRYDSTINGIQYINGANVFEATGKVDGEKYLFAGMTLADVDEINNVLTFEIGDMVLAEKLLKRG